MELIAGEFNLIKLIEQTSQMFSIQAKKKGLELTCSVGRAVPLG